MTDWYRIADHFNQTAKCRRFKDGKPKVSYEPGCLHIGCEHKNCACRMNFHGDEKPTLTEILKWWQESHG